MACSKIVNSCSQQGYDEIKTNYKNQANCFYTNFMGDTCSPTCSKLQVNLVVLRDWPCETT